MFNFPDTPYEGQNFTPSGGPSYVYRAPRWLVVPVVSSGEGGPADWMEITNKPATFPPSSHTHPQSDVTNLVADLAAKEPSIATGTIDKFWRGDKTWAVPAGGGGGAATSVGDAPPASPTAGQLWFQSSTGLLFIWYQDANSSQWVPATVGAQGPPGQWTQVTQAEYDALSPPDPAILYVVIG